MPESDDLPPETSAPGGEKSLAPPEPPEESGVHPEVLAQLRALQQWAYQAKAREASENVLEIKGSPEPVAEAPELPAEAAEIRAEAPELHAEPPGLHVEAPDLPAEALPAEAAALHAEVSELHAEPPEIFAEAAEPHAKAPEPSAEAREPEPARDAPSGAGDLAAAAGLAAGAAELAWDEAGDSGQAAKLPAPGKGRDRRAIERRHGRPPAKQAGGIAPRPAPAVPPPSPGRSARPSPPPAPPPPPARLAQPSPPAIPTRPARPAPAARPALPPRPERRRLDRRKTAAVIAALALGVLAVFLLRAPSRSHQAGAPAPVASQGQPSLGELAAPGGSRSAAPAPQTPPPAGPSPVPPATEPPSGALQQPPVPRQPEASPAPAGELSRAQPSRPAAAAMERLAGRSKSTAATAAAGPVAPSRLPARPPAAAAASIPEMEAPNAPSSPDVVVEGPGGPSPANPAAAPDLPGTPDSLPLRPSPPVAPSPQGVPAPGADAGSVPPDEAGAATEPESESPAGSPAPRGRQGENLNGSWEIRNVVNSTSVPGYRGLRLTYRILLRQEGGRISGDGEKWAENDRRIPAAQRTPIHVSGEVVGREVRVRFTERGSRRVSAGSFRWRLSPDGGSFSGTFASNAADSRGSSAAVRLP